MARDADLFADASGVCPIVSQADNVISKVQGRLMLRPHQLRGLNCPVIFVVKLLPRMSVGIIRIRRRHRMLMLPLLSPSIREIIQTGIVKVVIIKGVLIGVQSNNNATEHQSK